MDVPKIDTHAIAYHQLDREVFQLAFRDPQVARKRNRVRAKFWMTAVALYGSDPWREALIRTDPDTD